MQVKFSTVGNSKVLGGYHWTLRMRLYIRGLIHSLDVIVLNKVMAGLAKTSRKALQGPQLG